MSTQFDLIVIGTGITGLSAARQAAQEGLATATLEILFFGGLVTNVNELDGEIEGSGSDVAAGMMMEASKLGVKSVTAGVTGLARDGDWLVVESDAGRHRARAVVIASGARLRKLGIPGEAEFEENGISHCADCDGPFYKGQDVVVVGGGDSALQEALVLAGYAKTVHLIHRGPQFRAKAQFAERIASASNVTVHLRTEVEAVLGDKAVVSVRVRNQEGAQSEIACTGVFPYIGLEPACGFVPPSVLRDAAGCLTTDAAYATALPGVYAAGAVRSGYGGMLVHAVAEGAAAAKSAAARIRG